MVQPKISRFGNFVYIEFCNKIDLECNRHVHSLDAWIRDKDPEWLVESVPSYGTLGLVVDFDRVSMEELVGLLSNAIAESRRKPPRVNEGRTVTLHVRYGGEFGPDLDDVASETGLSIGQVIELHTSREYQCFMLGFSPGFVYLGEVDERIRVGRLKTPRTRVPEGSVGLAGAQTGFYGVSSPGGWRIIGRLVEKSFDVLRNPPSMVLPGDRVRFVSATEE